MRIYRDRDDAGRQLAAALERRGYRDPLVLGIPRGGVVPAARVAQALGCELGVVVARKLRAPGQPELAIGAVATDGAAWLNGPLVRQTGASGAYLQRERATQAAEAARREAAFDGRHRPAVAGRTVIIVDDGIATGATAIAAVRAMRAAGAGSVVLAAPVAAPHTVEDLRAEADEVVVLQATEDFYAIGQFYRDFTQVDDAQVRRLLDEAEREHGAKAAAGAAQRRAG